MSTFFLKKVLPATVAIAAIWLGVKYLLPVALPFLLGAAVALLAEPLVQPIANRLNRTVGAAAGVSLTPVRTCRRGIASGRYRRAAGGAAGPERPATGRYCPTRPYRSAKLAHRTVRKRAPAAAAAAESNSFRIFQRRHCADPTSKAASAGSSRHCVGNCWQWGAKSGHRHLGCFPHFCPAAPTKGVYCRLQLVAAAYSGIKTSPHRLGRVAESPTEALRCHLGDRQRRVSADADSPRNFVGGRGRPCGCGAHFGYRYGAGALGCGQLAARRKPAGHWSFMHLRRSLYDPDGTGTQAGRKSAGSGPSDHPGRAISRLSVLGFSGTVADPDFSLRR